jgi:hypothetical protein
MKNRYTYGLILLILILIVLSIGFGLLAIKKSKSINKTDQTVENLNQSNSPNQISESGNQENTAKTITCPDCKGSGNVVCPECEGRGLYYICSACNGKYHTYLNTCPFCGSRNTLTQHVCSETIKCPRCGGSGQIPS